MGWWCRVRRESFERLVADVDSTRSRHRHTKKTLPEFVERRHWMDWTKDRLVLFFCPSHTFLSSIGTPDKTTRPSSTTGISPNRRNIILEVRYLSQFLKTGTFSNFKDGRLQLSCPPPKQVIRSEGYRRWQESKSRRNMAEHKPSNNRMKTWWFRACLNSSATSNDRFPATPPTLGTPEEKKNSES